MQDRYLFRGKRIDNGEWVHGYLFDDGFENGRVFIGGIVIEKYNAGFIQEFIKYQIQQTFTIEMLDCLMYIYMEFKDIENDLLKYMQNDGKHTFTELLKFMNISVIDFRGLYEKYISTNPIMTGYMRYVNDEIKNIINK